MSRGSHSCSHRSQRYPSSFTFAHKRSNVETTFSMIKAKFGTRIRSKTAAAPLNEVLCKVLAHNVRCLVQSMYELGIEPAFWKAS